jgi:hypothetical protein
MSRWIIERQGTGIERSGTGIERSGTGIERSGTGIERSGSGVERSGTGIRRFILTSCAIAIGFAGGVQAGEVSPHGSLQLVVNNGTVAVSWIFDESVFSGISNLEGSFANVALTEIALDRNRSSTQVAGTGSGVEVAGTGSGVEATKSGDINVFNPITVTLPASTGIAMEVTVGCGTARVAVLDTNSVEVVAFDRVQVIGDSMNCDDGFGSTFKSNPGADFRSTD